MSKYVTIQGATATAARHGLLREPIRYPGSMSPRLRASAVWLALATCPTAASGDALPYDELSERPIDVTVSLTGLAQFPGHVFYLYPSRCTAALGALDVEGSEYVLSNPELRGDHDDYRELHDGPLDAWLSQSNYCANSRIYALARSIAGRVDLDAMTPVARQQFFDADPRLFRAGLDLPDAVQALSKYSRLRGLHEVVRVSRLTASGLTLVVDAATYRFAGDIEQTLRLAHTQRPALPFKPLSQDKLDKYSAAFAAWEARQPAGPASAPMLPTPAEKPDETPDDDPAVPPTEPASDLPVDTPPADRPTATHHEPAALGSVVAPSAAPAPSDPPPDPPVPNRKDMFDESGPSSTRWSVTAGIALVVALAGLALARRRR